jgi:hypothetical protein
VERLRKTTKYLKSLLPVFGQRIKPRSSRIRSKNANHTTALFVSSIFLCRLKYSKSIAGEGNGEFGLTKYLCSYFEGIFNKL